MLVLSNFLCVANVAENASEDIYMREWFNRTSGGLFRFLNEMKFTINFHFKLFQVCNGENVTENSSQNRLLKIGDLRYNSQQTYSGS